MAMTPKLPLLPIAGGAVVVAVAVSLLMNAWTAQAPGAARGSAGADGHAHEHALAAFYDIEDPAQVLIVPAAEAPRVTMHLTQASDGALRLRLELANFAFAGPDAGIEHIAGKGHAHLYLDGAYVTDFSGAEQTLPPLPPGNHEFTVGLNSVDHRAYATDGRIVGDRLVVRLPDVRRRSPIAAAKTFAVEVRGGRVAGDNTIRVRQNETVRLQWTTDVPVALHLEGYDLEAQVTPQAPVSFLFVADAAGRFPVEEHTEAGGHGRGALFYLEVYP